MRRGGVVFYDKHRQRVLVYRRDNKPTIPFPDQLDILGGHTEEGETPAQTLSAVGMTVTAGSRRAARLPALAVRPLARAAKRG